MMTDPRSAFAALLAPGRGRVELARAALLIAAEEYPELSIPHYLERLGELAERVGRRLHADAGPRETIARMRTVLIEEEGFVGNRTSYYDPRNSFLNDVLDRRTGIPITLSTVYLSVAERVGFPLEGVGFPGHFLVKHPGDDELIVDPFHGGQIESREALEKRLASASGDPVRLEPKLTAAVSTRQILFRMLTNLKSIYFQQQDWPRALAAVERMLLVAPGAPRERRDRGIFLSRLNRPIEAVQELARYRELRPEADDRFEVETLIDQLKRLVSLSN